MSAKFRSLSTRAKHKQLLMFACELDVHQMRQVERNFFSSFMCACVFKDSSLSGASGSSNLILFCEGTRAPYDLHRPCLTRNYFVLKLLTTVVLYPLCGGVRGQLNLWDFWRKTALRGVHVE